MASGNTERDTRPTAGTLAVVGVVVVLGVAAALFVVVSGGTESVPTAAVDAEQVQDHIVVSHNGGDTIETENLAVTGGSVTEGPARLQDGGELIVEPDADAEEVVVRWESSDASRVLARSEFENAQSVWPPASTVEIPITEFGNVSEEQYTALESLNLTDPFTLAVSAPDLAGENSTDYAVTAFYGAFNETPSDRLSTPSVPLTFDENGTATVTVGSAGTDADVTTWMAFGSLSENATLVNNIEVPAGAELVAVETAD